ncbi:MAG: DUF1552 domain-containing protein [Myxococcota bacterium]
MEVSIWTRRRLLKHLGLSLAAAPFLGRTPKSLAQTGTPPQRLILIPSLNGGAPEHFWPSGQTMATIAAPLQPWADRIQFIKGLNIEGSTNHMAVRSIFTGASISDYSAPDPTVPSLDQLVAKTFTAVRPAPIRSLHLGACPAQDLLHYQLHGRSTFFFDPSPLDYEANPVTAFDRFLGSTSSEQKVDADVVEDILDQRIRAITRQELADLEARVSSSPREAAKLALHLSSLPSQDHIPTPGSCSPQTIPSVEALRSLLQGNPAGAYNQALYGQLMDAQIDIIARAITCGLTRVATLQYNFADGNTPVPVAPGVLLEHHNTSHGSAGDFALVQQWYATKLARLVAQLDVPDPLDAEGRTVLDNSLILWMNECNSGHDNISVPCLYIGSAGGVLHTGSLLETTTTHRALLGTLCDAFGVPTPMSDHLGSARIEALYA